MFTEHEIIPSVYIFQNINIKIYLSSNSISLNFLKSLGIYTFPTASVHNIMYFCPFSLVITKDPKAGNL